MTFIVGQTLEFEVTFKKMLHSNIFMHATISKLRYEFAYHTYDEFTFHLSLREHSDIFIYVIFMSL